MDNRNEPAGNKRRNLLWQILFMSLGSLVSVLLLLDTFSSILESILGESLVISFLSFLLIPVLIAFPIIIKKPILLIIPCVLFPLSITVIAYGFFFPGDRHTVILFTCVLFAIMAVFGAVAGFLIRLFRPDRRKAKIVAAVVFVFVSALGFLFWRAHWIPAIYSIEEEQFSDYDDYILVRGVHYTGSGWTIVGDEKGYFPQDDIRDIELTGKRPPYSEMGSPVNTFLCIVEYGGQVDHVAFIEPISTYYVIEWYPVYPVVRSNSIWPDWMLPARFMTEKETKSY